MVDRQARHGMDRGQHALDCMAESPERFYLEYQPRLVRFLKTRASNVNWAEDIADEAVIAFLDKWDDLLTYDRPDSWLFAVAMQKLRRVEARARDLCCIDESQASSEREVRKAAETDDWVAEHLDLINAIRALPRRQCEVIGLHFLVDWTLPETARILGIEVGTVKRHLNRGIENLRRNESLAAAYLTGSPM